MRIGAKHGRGKPVFSFEFFPPKTDDGARALMTTVADLRDVLAPDFVSVTCGAGGSTRERTHDLVVRIQRELQLTTMAHLTCGGTTQAEIAKEVEQLTRAGVENVLALRGDPPAGSNTFAAPPGGFAHASELTAFLDSEFDVEIGAACYPEGHVESSDTKSDLDWTVHKVRQGVDFLITQLFLDNGDYFAFVDRARDRGIRVPIVPGIMPITNVAQVERFTKMCGAKIPVQLLERLRRFQDDPAAVMALGIEHAIVQCRGLLEGGAPGLHFYTLNKSWATRSILAAVRRV
ncbi:MAG TPA: methylenetetrahydrofolate reductase [NAD(P)H] [Planctomycetota bacterium]|nr:methylenetetrahydrofolate reductase [NAD(P)H] [Planctomycetota bacterium]